MASESTAHLAFGLMGYWLRAHEGSRNNCLLIETFRLSVHWVNCAYPFSCRGRRPLTLEKGLAFSQNRIWSWSFYLHLHLWQKESESADTAEADNGQPIHTDLRELWQTCGNWTTFYKVLCAMVCRVKDKDYFWFCFPLCFAIFLHQFSVFFLDCLFYQV